MPLAFIIGKAMRKMFKKPTQPLKEFETHGSPVQYPSGYSSASQDEEKSLDEVFREAAREGTLHE